MKRKYPNPRPKPKTLNQIRKEHSISPIPELITTGSQDTKVETHRWTQILSNGKIYQHTKRYIRENFEKGIWEESDDMKEWTICEEIR